MSGHTEPVAPPLPDNTNPEPLPATPADPEKGRVPAPAPGPSEHPMQPPDQAPSPSRTRSGGLQSASSP